MRWKGLWDVTFAGEVLLLAGTAPVLYFPSYFPEQAPYVALAALALGWVWRRIRLQAWLPQTPVLWPIVIFVAMIPVALWAAPATLRIQYSIPRTYILLWNLCLFWTVVTHGSRSRALASVCLVGFLAGGVAIALLAPLGTSWYYGKIPLFQPLLAWIPALLQGRFAGAEEGFHPNQVAGTLLAVLPMLLALATARFRRAGVGGANALLARHDRVWRGSAIVLLACTVTVMAIVVLTQSRASLFALLVSVVVMVWVRWARRGWFLLLGLAAILVGLMVFQPMLLDAISDAPDDVMLGGLSALEFRQKIWTQAITAIHDFPFTGIGFGTFRQLMPRFYPADIRYAGDIGHAHNFFLQTALDFGLPGLIGVLALYVVISVQVVQMCLWTGSALGTGRGAGETAAQQMGSGWAVGFLGCVVAQFTYGLLDAVTMGAKTNFMFWYLFALVAGVSNLVMRHSHR